MDGGNLAVVGVEQLLLNTVDRSVKLGIADRTFFTGAQHAVQQLLAVKHLAGAVLLYDHQRNCLNDLVGRKALFAVQALTAAANLLAVLCRAGVDDLGIHFTAIGAFHIGLPPCVDFQACLAAFFLVFQSTHSGVAMQIVL